MFFMCLPSKKVMSIRDCAGLIQDTDAHTLGGTLAIFRAQTLAASLELRRKSR